MMNTHDETDDEPGQPQDGPADEAQERMLRLLNEALDRDLVLLFEEDLAA